MPLNILLLDGTIVHSHFRIEVFDHDGYWIYCPEYQRGIIFVKVEKALGFLREITEEEYDNIIGFNM